MFSLQPAHLCLDLRKIYVLELFVQTGYISTWNIQRLSNTIFITQVPEGIAFMERSLKSKCETLSTIRNTMIEIIRSLILKCHHASLATMFHIWLEGRQSESKYFSTVDDEWEAHKRTTKAQFIATSSYGTIFRVTGPLCPQKVQWRGALMPLWSVPEQKFSEQSRRRWFETPLRSPWRHCNIHYCHYYHYIYKSQHEAHPLP